MLCIRHCQENDRTSHESVRKYLQITSDHKGSRIEELSKLSKKTTTKTTTKMGKIFEMILPPKKKYRWQVHGKKLNISH